MSVAQALIQRAQSSSPEVGGLLEALAASRRQAAAPMPRKPPVEVDRPYPQEHGGHDHQGAVRAHGRLTLPTSWKGTHDTSGADWNRNAPTAVDLMSAAGTIVGAPEPGVIERHGSAQGGQSLTFDPDAPGPDYWLGHLSNLLPIGTRIKRRGQRIALVSSDHAAPHVHADRIR